MKTKAVLVTVAVVVTLILSVLTSCSQDNECMVRAKYKEVVEEKVQVLQGKTRAKTWYDAITVDSETTISDPNLFDNKNKYNSLGIVLNNANIIITGKLGVKPQSISGSGIIYCDNAGTLNKNLGEHIEANSLATVQILNNSVLSTGSYTTNSLEYAPCDAEVGDVVEHNGKQYEIIAINF